MRRIRPSAELTPRRTETCSGYRPQKRAAIRIVSERSDRVDKNGVIVEVDFGLSPVRTRRVQRKTGSMPFLNATMKTTTARIKYPMAKHTAVVRRPNIKMN